ncbi:MAG: zinc transporter ZupT [Planctomycetes bacterium GWF2_41_51]|nr:MAG: zinc transporter ZupT [Planctomycetes bacterium GWF2_41_51]HBG28876.1 zinc transporter ZupT [Phycisphaerales bacterium]
MFTENLAIAFGLTVFAGLATGIGSAMAFFAKKTNTSFLSTSLGFSAGVMIYVSLIEIFAKAKAGLIEEMGPAKGYWVTVGAFFTGILLIAAIDKLIPGIDNPHEVKSIETLGDTAEAEKFRHLYRMGIFTALAVAIHNFPEGLATFTAAMKDVRLGIPIAVAIAIHNIPEGIAVSVPVYYATGSKKEAFWLSFLSGLAEPIGAILGYILLTKFLNGAVSSIIFAAVGGIMVFISIDQLLPTAEKYGKHHYAVYGFIAGMVVMAMSLLMFI